ncbi:hypothetical protein Trydic_g8967 [Trypoxylus dichotomus]
MKSVDILAVVILLIADSKGFHIPSEVCHYESCALNTDPYCFILENESAIAVLGECTAKDFKCHHPAARQIELFDPKCERALDLKRKEKA